MVTDVVDDAALFIPMNVPDDVVDRFEMFWTVLLSKVTGLVTDDVVVMPLITVASAVEAGVIRMLFVADPPTTLELTGVGGVAFAIRSPVIVDGAGTVPILVTSMPPAWLPAIVPPVL